MSEERVTQQISPITRGNVRDGCGFVCANDGVFSFLRVWPTFGSGNLVEWELSPHFKDPAPYNFTLQSAIFEAPDTDWQDVVGPVADVYFLQDNTTVSTEFNSWLHYRVKLETNNGTYYSPPISTRETFAEYKDYARWRGMIRAWQRALKLAGNQGFLLKKRLSGTPCSCVDPLTGESTDPNCPTCDGTGFVEGYYPAVDCTMAQLERGKLHQTIRPPLGSVVEGNNFVGVMLAFPLLFEQDVWVNRANGKRYFIHTIADQLIWKGVPVVQQVELRLAPLSDPVYKVDIPDQIPS